LKILSSGLAFQDSYGHLHARDGRARLMSDIPEKPMIAGSKAIQPRRHLNNRSAQT